MSNVPFDPSRMTSHLDNLMGDIATTNQRKNNPAGYMHERIMQKPQRFQQTLGPDEELGIHVVGGMPEAFHLRQLSFSDPDILVFTGLDARGNNVQLLQHHSQMGIMLVVVTKIEEKPYRMGFPTS